MAVKITTRQELEEWLEDKPDEWAHVVALRVALRVLPFACLSPQVIGDYLALKYPLQLLRTCAIISGASVEGFFKFRVAMRSAIKEIEQSAKSLAARTAVADMGLSSSSIEARLANSADNAALTAYFAASASLVATETAYAAVAAANAARSFAAAAITSPSASNPASIAYADAVTDVNDAEAAIWASISADCRLLSSEAVSPSKLSQIHLWRDAPSLWTESWHAARRLLSASPGGFDIWREWYHGRVQGLPRAFKDFDEVADEAFYRWIVEQDDAWWNREPREVNADVKAKVEELRKPQPPSDSELQQEPDVVNYVVDDQGITQLAPEPLPNGVQDDQDNQDNYGEIKRLIEEALDECDPTKTQDKSMAPATSILQDSLGSNLSELSPRLFVLRAKEVIRRFEARQSGEAMIPLSQGQVDAFAPLIDALKTLAEFDPKLSQIWSGSSEGKASLTRDQLETIVLALAQVKQMSPEAQQTAETYLAQVDAEAGPDDPDLKKANDSVGNAVKAMGKAVKKGDEALKTTDRAIRVAEKGSKIWEMVRGRIPDGETITNILDWISKMGGPPV